ncbi:MAG: hypothetical protein JJT93_14710 [Gammaproteobacteria bacterium]|nr:hypothetical protein [Gammaproteobacteria bacterium]
MRHPAHVMIAGSGHIDRGFGIPLDLQRLGEHRVFSLALLPARPELDTPDRHPGDYDAIWFTPPVPSPPRPLRGKMSDA